MGYIIIIIIIDCITSDQEHNNYCQPEGRKSPLQATTDDYCRPEDTSSTKSIKAHDCKGGQRVSCSQMDSSYREGLERRTGRRGGREGQDYPSQQSNNTQYQSIFRSGQQQQYPQNSRNQPQPNYQPEWQQYQPYNKSNNNQYTPQQYRHETESTSSHHYRNNNQSHQNSHNASYNWDVIGRQDYVASDPPIAGNQNLDYERRSEYQQYNPSLNNSHSHSHNHSLNTSHYSHSSYDNGYDNYDNSILGQDPESGKIQVGRYGKREDEGMPIIRKKKKQSGLNQSKAKTPPPQPKPKIASLVEQASNQCFSSTKQEITEHVTCPFNNSHIMIPSRLLTHIHKCKLSSESAPLYKNCPYDPCHYFRYDQIEAHILTCDKRTLFSNEVEWENLPAPELDRTQITNGASSDTASRADQSQMIAANIIEMPERQIDPLKKQFEEMLLTDF